MEEEEREAQSAKLQELIRRGNPEDLQEANRLMKIMAGFDTRSKTDYRAKAAEDVGKIQAKARLLEERLAAFQPGDKMTEGDVFEELASALSSAQPKIQKMCEEESDDHEAVAKLLEINDSIHRTVERWKLLKKGDIEGANAIAQGAPIQTLQGSGGQASTSAANELSLIDFDADASGTNGSGNNGESSSQAAGVENDLLGLSLDGGSSTFGQGGGISLGFGANSSMSSHGPQAKGALLTPGNRHSRPAFTIVNDPELKRNRRCQRPYTSLIHPILWLHLAPCRIPVQHPSTPGPFRLQPTSAKAGRRPVRCFDFPYVWIKACYTAAPSNGSCTSTGTRACACRGNKRRRRMVVLFSPATRRALASQGPLGSRQDGRGANRHEGCEVCTIT